MLKNLFAPLVVGLIIWFVQYHYKDIPTAIYTVSDSMEIVGSQGKIEFAQEITVTNSGQNAVKDISIKIPQHISTFKLTKHSSLTQEKSFSEKNSFELIYPELPSGQKIRLQIRYDGYSIAKNWISISHANGNAQAQENQTPAINYLWIWLAFLFGSLTQTLSEIRRWKRESFRKWVKEEEIFRNDKAWFARTVEWSEMQFEAIERTLLGYNFSDIEQTTYFQLLNRSKPTLLSDEHWVKLEKLASTSLMERFSKEVTKYSNTERLLDLFKIKKPLGLSIELWSDFQKSLIEKLKDKLFPAHMKTEDYENILDPNNLILNSLPDPIANEFRELAQKYYSEHLTSRDMLERHSEPLTVLKTARLDLVTASRAASVKDNIFRIARMMAMPSHWGIRDLELFLSKGRPEWMPVEEFNSIFEFVSQAKSLSDERNTLRQHEIELETTKEETENLKKRVIKQLEMIDRVLTNPSSIEKIEDYDQTFAPGNKRNLELIASLLKN